MSEFIDPEIDEANLVRVKCSLCEDTFLIIYQGTSEIGQFLACPKCDPLGVAKQQNDIKQGIG